MTLRLWKDQFTKAEASSTELNQRGLPDSIRISKIRIVDVPTQIHSELYDGMNRLPYCFGVELGSHRVLREA